VVTESAVLPPDDRWIHIRGASQHNLRGVDVSLPQHRLTVVTGPSGSGKSSLAFDTLFAEGQRRYVSSLSAYARQFLDQLQKPEVEQIVGLSPAIAIATITCVCSTRTSAPHTVRAVAKEWALKTRRRSSASCRHCPMDDA
jgi:excinuclease ABC subunit A